MSYLIPLQMNCKVGIVIVFYTPGDDGYKEGWYWGLTMNGNKSAFVHMPIGPFNSKYDAHASARNVHTDLPTWVSLSRNGGV